MQKISQLVGTQTLQSEKPRVKTASLASLLFEYLHAIVLLELLC